MSKINEMLGVHKFLSVLAVPLKRYILFVLNVKNYSISHQDDPVVVQGFQQATPLL